MREVTGYLTDDGAFYEDAIDAEKHEAIHALTGAYHQFVGKGGNIERFQNVLINLAPEIRRYLDAIEGPEDKQRTRDETDEATIERDLRHRPSNATVGEHTPDDGLRGAFEGVLKQ